MISKPMIPGGDSSFGRDIDRLVDGALDERQRNEVLLKLDAEPGGWKLCALAFLEAQTFRDAFGSFLDAKISEGPKSDFHVIENFRGRQIVEPLGTTRRKPWFFPAVVSASVFLAFCAGWILKPGLADSPGFQGDPGNTGPQMATQSNEDSRLALAKPGERKSGETNPPKGSTDSAIEKPGNSRVLSDSVQLAGNAIRQLEKNGYSANFQRQMISVKTPDGRTVDLPVREFVLKYRGKQTY